MSYVIWTAAEEGNVEAVKGYLAIGVNVDERDESYGGTPLHFAAYSGSEVVELLIANGADVNAKNQADATPLDKAIEKNWDETAALLRMHGGKTAEKLPQAPDISIHEAVAEGNIEAVKQHLAAGTDVNAKDRHKNTPLHAAAAWGQKEIAELPVSYTHLTLPTKA